MNNPAWQRPDDVEIECDICQELYHGEFIKQYMKETETGWECKHHSTEGATMQRCNMKKYEGMLDLDYSTFGKLPKTAYFHITGEKGLFRKVSDTHAQAVWPIPDRTTTIPVPSDIAVTKPSKHIMRRYENHFVNQTTGKSA